MRFHCLAVVPFRKGGKRFIEKSSATIAAADGPDWRGGISMVRRDRLLRRPAHFRLFAGSWR